MIQMAHRRKTRTIIAVGIFLILAAGALFAADYFFHNERFFEAGVSLFSIGIIIIILRFRVGERRHHLDRGRQFAKLHYQIEKSVNQALYDAGIYVERDVLLRKCALLPNLEIIINDDFSSGTIKIENRVKHDHRLEELPISSALPEEFVLTASYVSDDQNFYVYEFERFNLENLVFNSFKEYQRHVREVGAYDFFLNNRHVLPMHHILLIGQTGSGKSYGLYALILQMISKDKPWELFVIDPKFSGLFVLGSVVCRDRVAYTVDDSIELLRVFYQRMQQRKEEMKENLMLKLDADYRDFGLIPICLIIDEYSAFNATLARCDKKTRDEVSEILGNLVREGRQLGCFLVIAQQQTNAQNLSTELKENIPCKVILGMAERQTYVTALGVYPDVAKRHFDVGQGLLVYPGIASPELPAITSLPTLHFDILSAAQAALQKESGGAVSTPAPYRRNF